MKFVDLNFNHMSLWPASLQFTRRPSLAHAIYVKQMFPRFQLIDRKLQRIVRYFLVSNTTQ